MLMELTLYYSCVHCQDAYNNNSYDTQWEWE